MEFLRENAAQIAAWMPLVALIVTVASLAASMRARARGDRRQFLWLNLTGASVIALIVMFGPMSPLFSSARTLDSWRGRPAPPVSFRDLSTGRDLRLDALRGRVVLVNIWATWCPPCRQEMPALNRLQKSYASRGVVVLTLTDDTSSRVRPFLARYAADTMNGTTSFDWLPVQKFRPFTFVVDRNGIMRDFFFGSQEYVTLEKTIRRYL